MLTYTEWQKIKAELKKNIEPIFAKAGITLSIPFEQVLDIFQGVLEKEIGSEDLDDRDLVLNALKKRYTTKDWWDDSKSILFDLSIKFESFVKRLYHSSLANETLLNPTKRNIAEYLKTFWNKFKTASDTDFQYVSTQEIHKFFDRDSNDRPIHKPDIFLTNSFPLGYHFKTQYDLANSGRHLDPSITDDEIPKLITSVVSCYLFMVLKYSNRLERKVIHQPDLKTVSDWSIFKQYCGNFQRNQTYFLITDKLNLSQEQLSLFANIKWDFIFDFDTNSENNGLFDAFKSSNFPQAIHQIIHKTDDGNRIDTIFPTNTTFWYFVQGNSGMQKSLLQNQNFETWRGMYQTYTQKLMSKYYSENYSRKYFPIKVVYLSKDTQKARTLHNAIKDMGEGELNIDFIFANDDNVKLENLISEISGKRVELPIPTLLEGLRELKNSTSLNSDKIYFPCHSSRGDKRIELSNADVLSIKQYFQIIHLNILNETQEHASEKTFY